MSDDNVTAPVEFEVGLVISKSISPYVLFIGAIKLNAGSAFPTVNNAVVVAAK